MAYSDRELLARLIQCEAGGEGNTGMAAVASVVMNRVNARGGEYARVGQGSIRNIIFFRCSRIIPQFRGQKENSKTKETPPFAEIAGKRGSRMV